MANVQLVYLVSFSEIDCNLPYVVVGSIDVVYIVLKLRMCSGIVTEAWILSKDWR
jgi:hypothetical protein